MKTAMQELIDYLQKEVDNYPEDCIKGIVPREALNGMHHSNLVLLGKVEKLLEKEKAHIINAYNTGRFNEIDKKQVSSEQFYNEIYKNK